MDRAIDPVFASSQKRRRLFMVAAAAGLLALAFGFGPSLLKPSVLRSRVRIEKVDRGPVEASIAANGTVTPELEQGTRAPRDSVVTWTVTEAGALVRRGEPLARLSDLKSFRIEATVSAVHGRSLRPGLEALVRIGTVSTVEPTVRDGVMRLWIRLEDATNAVLRPSLKADVQIVTDRRADAVRVARGPFLSGEAGQDVFVVRDGRAFRTRVDLGLIGYDVVEITRGLEPEDEMIVSDMTNYLHARELKLK